MFQARLRTPEDAGIVMQQARLAAGLTQRELAERLGISQRYVWEMESGKDSPALRRLLDALEATGARVYVDVPEGALDD